MKIDLECHWHINYFCNYRCFYCFFGRNKRDTSISLPDIQRIVDGFSRGGRAWLINITGGEPFFFPGFVDLCKELTKKHMISINTNISHSEVYRFGETISPDKVGYIHCALHIQEREKSRTIADFLEKYKFLEARGFYIFASYVMHPGLVNRFDDDYRYFKSLGVILRPKVFRGNEPRLVLPESRIFSRIRRLFERTYPQAYSPKQRDDILAFIDRSEEDGNFKRHYENGVPVRGLVDVGMDRLFLNGLSSFKGKYCLAGKSCVRMTPTGDVYRCHGGEHHLGNLFREGIDLFEEPRKCPHDVCSCPYMGHNYVRENVNPA